MTVMVATDTLTMTRTNAFRPVIENAIVDMITIGIEIEIVSIANQDAMTIEIADTVARITTMIVVVDMDHLKGIVHEILAAAIHAGSFPFTYLFFVRHKVFAQKLF